MEQADGYYDDKYIEEETARAKEWHDEEDKFLKAVKDARERLHQAGKDLEKAENDLIEFYGYRI